MHGGSIMTRRLRIAAFGVGTLAAALFAATGGAAPKQPRIETGLELGTPANLHEPKIRALLGIGS